MTRHDDMRLRILDATLRLLVGGGREAVSTRSVTSAVNIQAPTIYRIFGDKQGLLDAVALHGFEAHLASWQGWHPGSDPIDTMRQGWDMHVQWGIDNPELYSIAYGGARPGTTSAASDAIDSILHTLIEQAAIAGHLTIPVAQAVSLLRAIGTGVVFTLIAMPEGSRDMQLSERGREAALSAFLTATAFSGATVVSPTDDRSGAAMQLKTDLADSTELTTNEKALFGDWLDRLAGGPHRVEDSPSSSSGGRGRRAPVRTLGTTPAGAVR